jgi:hypothetical protein
MAVTAGVSLKLMARSSATAMSFPAQSGLSRCSPPRLPSLAPAPVVLDGVRLADEIAVSELWLEDDVLVASFGGGGVIADFEVRVEAEPVEAVIAGVADDVEVSCSCGRCGNVELCEHGVAALLCAHGQAGAAARLVSAERPRPAGVPAMPIL